MRDGIGGPTTLEDAVTVFDIHDEGDFAVAATFLSGWLPEAIAHLGQLLGIPEMPPVVHVFLSPSEAHEERFPPRKTEVLLNDGGEQSAEDIPIRSETYAHGVAHVTSRGQHLPPGVPEDEPAIGSAARIGDT